MKGAHIKPSGTVRHMSVSSAKVLLLLALLAHVLHMADGMSGCCARRPRACGLYGLLCQPGAGNDTGVKAVRVSNEAATGILTLGKRKPTDSRYQDRLQHFLHGARNQAAGILTMGRRSEEPRAGDIGAIHTPVKLDLERPVEYLIQQPEARDPYGR